jgi:hypothetical protein
MTATLNPHLVADADRRAYVLAGNSRFTLKHLKSGNHLSFRVQACRDKADLFFVQVLTGPDNENDYQYLGIIRDGVYSHGRKSRIGEDAVSAQTFKKVWERIDHLPACIEMWHDGRCGRCGRVLTVPESVAQGIGPECIKHMAA